MLALLNDRNIEQRVKRKKRKGMLHSCIPEHCFPILLIYSARWPDNNWVQGTYHSEDQPLHQWLQQPLQDLPLADHHLWHPDLSRITPSVLKHGTGMYCFWKDYVSTFSLRDFATNWCSNETQISTMLLNLHKWCLIWKHFNIFWISIFCSFLLNHRLYSCLLYWDTQPKLQHKLQCLSS